MGDYIIYLLIGILIIQSYQIATIQFIAKLMKSAEKDHDAVFIGLNKINKKMDHFQTELKIPEPVFHVKHSDKPFSKPKVTRRTESMEYELELPKEKMGEKFF